MQLGVGRRASENLQGTVCAAGRSSHVILTALPPLWFEYRLPVCVDGYIPSQYCPVFCRNFMLGCFTRIHSNVQTKPTCSCSPYPSQGHAAVSPSPSPHHVLCLASHGVQSISKPFKLHLLKILRICPFLFGPIALL